MPPAALAARIDLNGTLPIPAHNAGTLFSTLPAVKPQLAIAAQGTGHFLAASTATFCASVKATPCLT